MCPYSQILTDLLRGRSRAAHPTPGICGRHPVSGTVGLAVYPFRDWLAPHAFGLARVCYVCSCRPLCVINRVR